MTWGGIIYDLGSGAGILVSMVCYTFWGIIYCGMIGGEIYYMLEGFGIICFVAGLGII